MTGLNYKSIEENKLIAVIAKSEKIQKITLDLLKYFLNNKKASCAYVTIAKPYKTIMNILTKNKIKTEQIIFIDCITSLSLGTDLQRISNCIFCKPESLTNISIALTSALDSLPKYHERILILDTLSTLMLYNQSKSINAFMHILTGKLREMGIRLIILTLEEETDKEIISEMTQFCDKVIK